MGVTYWNKKQKRYSSIQNIERLKNTASLMHRATHNSYYFCSNSHSCSLSSRTQRVWRGKKKYRPYNSTTTIIPLQVCLPYQTIQSSSSSSWITSYIFETILSPAKSLHPSECNPRERPFEITADKCQSLTLALYRIGITVLYVSALRVCNIRLILVRSSGSKYLHMTQCIHVYPNYREWPTSCCLVF